jgi:hypothetical protein
MSERRAETATVGLVGLYDDPAALLRAAAAVRDAGFTRWDCHTPYPVHGLERAMGLRPSPIGIIALAAGLCGVAAALGMQGWMNAIDYPLNVGGKPLFSGPAFVPIAFEFFVLFAALAATACGVALCGLFRWHSPLHDTGVMAAVTSSRFALVLDSRDPRFDPAAGRRLLEETGCREVRPLLSIVEKDRSVL